MSSAALHPIREVWAGAKGRDLVEAVRFRLRALAAVVSLASLLYLGLGFSAWVNWAGAGDAGLGPLSPMRAITTLLLVAAALTVLLVSWYAKRERSLELAGIGFTLAVATLAGLGRHDMLGALEVGPGSGWSGIALLLVLLPVLVPISPREALLTGLLATGLDMGACALVGHFHGEHPPLAVYLMLFRGTLVACGIAWAVARVVDDLRLQLHSALRLGSYELIERLGEGGMGEVWRAQHGLLARPAAVKLIKTDSLRSLGEHGRETIVARFEREAQTTALLESPHTIDVYDFGVAADGTLYYAMELLEGIDLHDAVLRFGSMPPERVVYLMLQACESLAEAHARGLIHRDIKPANLFLCSYGGRLDFLKILDFGLVKVRDLQGEGAEQLTGEGVTGTPAFLPPEQAIEGREIDARSDIYALGCVAYWLLTTHFVFEAHGTAQYVLKHVSETPVPPGKRVGKLFPAELEGVIMRALAKDPDLRQQSAEQLGHELRATGLAEGWDQVRARAWWAVNQPTELSEGELDELLAPTELVES